MYPGGNGRLAGLFLALCFSVIAAFGCASTSQIGSLEKKTEQALMKGQQALEEAKRANAAVEGLAVEGSQLSENTDRAEEAAMMAERAALSAQKAARDARESADRAERAARKCEEILERITAK